jgi:hypothetical protein
MAAVRHQRGGLAASASRGSARVAVVMRRWLRRLLWRSVWRRAHKLQERERIARMCNDLRRRCLEDAETASSSRYRQAARNDLLLLEAQMILRGVPFRDSPRPDSLN